MNSPETMNRIRNVVPESADAHMDEVLGKNSEPGYDLAKDELLDEKADSESMSKRIKVKFIYQHAVQQTAESACNKSNNYGKTGRHG